jgi:hypothetical protein
MKAYGGVEVFGSNLGQVTFYFYEPVLGFPQSIGECKDYTLKYDTIPSFQILIYSYSRTMTILPFNSTLYNLF